MTPTRYEFPEQAIVFKIGERTLIISFEPCPTQPVLSRRTRDKRGCHGLRRLYVSDGSDKFLGRDLAAKDNYGPFNRTARKRPGCYFDGCQHPKSVFFQIRKSFLGAWSEKTPPSRYPIEGSGFRQERYKLHHNFTAKAIGGFVTRRSIT